MSSKRDESPKRSSQEAKQYNMERLHIDGFVVLKEFINIPKEVFRNIVEKQSKRALPIFNATRNGKTYKGDGKRLQFNLVKNQIVKPFLEDLNRKTSQLCPHHNPSNWVVLKSETGCSQQPAHTDYEPMPGFADQDIPLVLMIALENDATLQVWPCSIRMLDKPENPNQLPPLIVEQTVPLSAGDGILIRGDLVHAGSAYKTKPNRRLHCFLDSKSADKRQPNSVWLIDDPDEVPDYVRHIIIHRHNPGQTTQQPLC